MTTASAAFVAIAASTAWPPARRIASPAAVARWWGATTAPRRPLARGIGTSGVACAAPLIRTTRRAPTASPARGGAPSPGAARAGQREQEQPAGREEEAVHAQRVGHDPADQAARDLPDPEEDGVEAHDRPPVTREPLADVGQEADRGRRGAGQDEQARREDETGRSDRRGDDRGSGGGETGMVHHQPRGDEAHPAADAEADDARPAEPAEPVAPPQDPGPEDQGDHDGTDRDLVCRETL